MLWSAAIPTSPSQALMRLGPSLSPLKGGEGLRSQPPAALGEGDFVSDPDCLFCSLPGNPDELVAIGVTKISEISAIWALAGRILD
jgi:hypothetical protein